jgi:uncharacterized membrane-anchored protein YitT (DUF2179 family)
MIFFEPNDIVTGGVSGAGIVMNAYIEEWFGISLPLAVFNIVFSAPLLIIGYRVLGRAFIKKTIFGSAMFSFALWVMSFFPPYKGDFIIIAVFGGVLVGVGVGLVLRCFASGGGSDLIGAIVNRLRGDIKAADAMFVFDAAVIAAGFLKFGLECGLYAIISVYITSKVADAVLEGFNFSLCAFIISPKSGEIARNIILGLERGVTGLGGTGMYTNQQISVLMCTVAKKEVLRLKTIVNDTDSGAFMVITDAKEVLGEGFEHNQ